jgi:hypothetical protein
MLTSGVIGLNSSSADFSQARLKFTRKVDLPPYHPFMSFRLLMLCNAGSCHGAKHSGNYMHHLL